MIMKYFNVARLFLVFMMLLGNTYAFADDLFTDQIVINVKQAVRCLIELVIIRNIRLPI